MGLLIAVAIGLMVGGVRSTGEYEDRPGFGGALSLFVAGFITSLIPSLIGLIPVTAILSFRSTES
jgi:hypothetical protein